MHIIKVMLPTHSNEGAPLDHTPILEEIIARFGGYTLEGPFEGAWKGADGQIYYETVKRVIIATPDLEGARHATQRWGARLNQEAMYFEHSPAGVEFLPQAG